jgi:hypothetical protein
MELQWCNGCLRDDKGRCEAFGKPYENCFAKITDKENYIKQQEEIIKYNKSHGNSANSTAAFRSIKRVSSIRSK